MPLEKQEMDQVIDDLFQNIFDLMEADKFYSTAELFEIVLNKKDDLKRYLPTKYEDSGTASTEEIICAIIPYIRDVAFLEAFIMSQLESRNLKIGFKKGKAYFAKI